MSYKYKFGNCSCGGEIVPVYFIEHESKITEYGNLVHTGRKRRACSHLICTLCLKTYCVDDSFDGEWYRED